MVVTGAGLDTVVVGCAEHTLAITSHPAMGTKYSIAQRCGYCVDKTYSFCKGEYFWGTSMQQLTRDKLLSELDPYLVLGVNKSPPKTGLTPYLVANTSNSLKPETVKVVEQFLYAVAQSDARRDGSACPWLFIHEHPIMLDPLVVNAIARSYLVARETLGRRHKVPLFLFGALNDLAAAKENGARHMRDMLMRRSSLKGAEKVEWERYLESHPGRDVRVLERYFSEQRDNPYRIWYLGAAALVLFFLNLYLYSAI